MTSEEREAVRELHRAQQHRRDRQNEFWSSTAEAGKTARQSEAQAASSSQNSREAESDSTARRQRMIAS